MKAARDGDIHTPHNQLKEDPQILQKASSAHSASRLKKAVSVIICGAKGMDQRLVKAAREGDVDTLHNLLKEDPEILEKECLGHSTDSAVHVAARRGKADFVKEIVALMPSLATATNQKGLIPLHMASAKGHVETVKELLKAKVDDDEDDDQVKMNQCLVREDYGWTPLHYAVFRGRVGVIEELMRHSPECVEEVTAKRETVLHLAVKANQLKAVEVIVESIKRPPNFQALYEAKDINGNTIYDLAPPKIRLQVPESHEISEEHRINMGLGRSHSEASKKVKSNKSHNLQDAILVMAALIITLTYQALANPPSTFLEEGSTKIDWSCLNKGSSQGLIKRLKDCPAVLALLFMIFNTFIFILSIQVVLFTLSGPTVLCVRLLALFLVFCYTFLLAAFYYNAVYVALPCALIALALFSFSSIHDEDHPERIKYAFRILLEIMGEELYLWYRLMIGTVSESFTNIRKSIRQCVRFH